jgi:hypothetical protein
LRKSEIVFFFFYLYMRSEANVFVEYNVLFTFDSRFDLLTSNWLRARLGKWLRDFTTSLAK